MLKQIVTLLIALACLLSVSTSRADTNPYAGTWVIATQSSNDEFVITADGVINSNGITIYVPYRSDNGFGDRGSASNDNPVTVDSSGFSFSRSTNVGWECGSQESLTATFTDINSVHGSASASQWCYDSSIDKMYSGSGSANWFATRKDLTAPVIMSFTIPTTSTSPIVPITALSATDEYKGVTGYLIAESPTPPLATAPGWSATVPQNYIFPTPGSKVLYAWAKDASGNVSVSRSAPVVITLNDTTPPTVTEFSIPAKASLSLLVPVTSFTATSYQYVVTGYLITENSTKPSAAATGWSASAPQNFLFTSQGNKTLYAWAKDTAGNVSAARSATIKVSLPDQRLTFYPKIAQFGDYRLILKDDGTVWQWGHYQQLTPLQIPGLDRVTGIAAGNGFNVVLKSDGTVWTWGYNFTGELGDGTTTTRSTPVKVSGLTGVTAIAIAKSNDFGVPAVAALKDDGTVWKWGANVLTPVQISGLSGIVAISMGSSPAALKNDGTVWCWGSGGALGDGTSVSRLTPGQVSGLNGVTAIAAYFGYTMALKGDGTVWSWGYNSNGQLGDGTTTNRLTPVQVSGLAGIKAFADRQALKNDGTVWVWGYPTSTTTFQRTPKKVGNLDGITALEGSVALKNDGTLWNWWDPSVFGGAATTELTPRRFSSLNGIIALGAVAVKNDGTVWAWGNNSAGQLGDGTKTSSGTPVQTKLYMSTLIITSLVTPATSDTAKIPISSFTVDDEAAVAGFCITEEILPDGCSWNTVKPDSYTFSVFEGYSATKSINVFVKDSSGKVSSAVSRTVTISTVNQSPHISAFSIPAFHGTLTIPVLSLTATDNVKVTGYLITETSTPPGSYAPGWSDHPQTNFVVSSSGIKTIYAWAKDLAGNVSAGRSASATITFPMITAFTIPATTTSLTIPITSLISFGYSKYLITESPAVPATTAPGWTAAPASFVASSSGIKTLYAWAKDDAGNLSAPKQATTNITLPGQSSVYLPKVTGGSSYTLALKNDGSLWGWGGTYTWSPGLIGGISGVIDVSAGFTHSVALKNDGTLWEWDNYSAHAPVQVSGLTGIIAIAAGYSHSVAVKNDGTVWAWGDNSSGQLGDGTSLQRLNPVQVGGLSGVTAIAAGFQHTVALKNDGTVWAWGYTAYGQPGSGYTPVPVSGLSGVNAIAAGQYHSLALKNDGSLWAWGHNGSGQLGDGTTTLPGAVVQVAGLNGITAFAAGEQHTVAVRNDGTVWTWGKNIYGLGDGISTSSSTPVQVLGLSDITAIGAGYSHTVALKSDGTVWAWGKNPLGNGTWNNSSIPVQAQINLMPVPAVTSFTLSASSSSASVQVASFSASDDVSVTDWCVTENGSASDCTWNSTKPVGYNFTGLTEGTTAVKSLYAFVRDADGNISPTVSAPVSIALANQPPRVTDFAIPSNSTSLTVPINTFNADDNIGVTGYLITENATPPAAASSGWSDAVPATFLASGKGSRTLYAWVKDAVGNVSASLSATTVITLPPQLLTVTVKGSGSVHSYPSGVACTGTGAGCAVPFDGGTVVQLMATESGPSHFVGWSGGCTGNFPNCFLPLWDDSAVAANFTSALPVQLVISDVISSYPTLTGAYGASPSGGVVTLRAMSGDYEESLTLQKNISVTLTGGMNSTFSAISGRSALHGVVTVRNGRLTVKNLNIW